MAESSILSLVEAISNLPEEFISDCTVTLRGVDSSNLFDLHKKYGSKTFRYKGDKLITIHLSDKSKIIAKLK